MKAHLFGTFFLEGVGLTVGRLSGRQQSLLAYLLLQRHHPQSRQQIAFLFWPGSPDGQAQTNLRQLLFHLRQAMPTSDDHWHITKKTVQWRTDRLDFLDVEQFETLVRRADVATDPGEVCNLLTQAITLYRGDLLPSCYDEWIVPERDRLRVLFLAAQERLIQRLEQQGNYRSAIQYAERLLQQDPLQEATYRTLMRLHTLIDDRLQALRLYQRCVTVLKQELGVDPEPATHQQYQQILYLGVPITTTTTGRATPISLPLIGRGQEWLKFQQIWQHTASHQPHFLLVWGEAGIGKTRFLEEISQWAGSKEAAIAQTRSYSAQGGLAYGPVTAWLRSARLQPHLIALNELWLSEVSRLLPELLITHPSLSHPQPLTDSWQQQRFFEALVQPFLACSSEQPLVLMLDDLQWSDQETLAWLSYILHAAAASPLLLVGAVRAGTVIATHPLQAWLAALRQEQLLTEIRLRPLGETESALLAQHLSLSPLSNEQLGTLFRETEGNPLFIIEMTRATLERLQGKPIQPMRGDSFAPTALPPRVQDVIEARLDQLSANALDLAERAAALGREFSLEVLASLPHGLSDETLTGGLDELWQRHIVREQSPITYDFSHDKIREVVYRRLSQARRRLLHRQTVEALLTLHATDPSPVNAQIAGHYEQASMPQQAIHYYQKAAQLAQQVYANGEVIQLLNKALQLLQQLPANEGRDAQELALRVSLAAPLIALTSYNSPEVFAHYHHVLSLCQRLGHPSDPRALRGLALAHILQADFPQCEELGQKIIDLAQTDQDDLLLVEGHYVLGVTAYWQGHFATSRYHLEQALVHFHRERRAVHIHTYAQDPEVVCLVRLGLTLWHLGYPDQAVQMVEQAVELAKINAHPFSQEYATHIAEILYDLNQDIDQLQLKTAALFRLIEQHNVSNYMHKVAIFFDAWLANLRGEHETSAKTIRFVIQDRQKNHIYLGVPHLMQRLAMVYWHSGQIQQALVIVEEALMLVKQRGEACWMPELLYTKGIFLQRQNGSNDEVALCFHQAMDIARQQGAKMLELRANVSLCRLWQSIGNTRRLAQSLQSLQSLYRWFTEGFNALDLQEARALLDELL